MTEMMKKRPTLFFQNLEVSPGVLLVIFYHLCCISPMLYLLVRMNLFGACHI